MTEFDADKHEKGIKDGYARLAKYALFDEMIDYALDGMVTLDEAVIQYKHDLERMESEGE